MNRRVWIVLAAGAVALIAWRLWPEDSSDLPHPSETAARTGSDSAEEGGPATSRAPASKAAQPPPPPVRMRANSRAPAGPSPAVSVLFEVEPRNPEWASKREEEVRVRAAKVLSSAEREGRRPPARLGTVECRSRSCRLSVSSDDPAVVARAIERLGEEDGFYRFADQMTVQAAEKGDDGPRRVDVYLRFSR